MTEKEYKEFINKKASAIKSKEDLNKFLDEIINYDHDYGTIIYGCAAAMSAAFNVVDNSNNGGITGFQAGCLGWEMVTKFMMVKEGAPLKLLDYTDLLYPQYEGKFDKVISSNTWEWIQKEAEKNIRENPELNNNVSHHWEKIVSGNIPFGYSVSAQ